MGAMILTDGSSRSRARAAPYHLASWAILRVMPEPASIVLCLPSGLPVEDPRPDLTAQRDLRVVTEWQHDTIGVVGWSEGGWTALAIAEQRPELPRLVIAALPCPGEEPTELDLELDLDAIVTKTLLLYGSDDPRTGHRHGALWQKRLHNARLEMVPGAGHELLPQVWARILSHVGPGRLRKDRPS